MKFKTARYLNGVLGPTVITSADLVANRAPAISSQSLAEEVQVRPISQEDRRIKDLMNSTIHCVVFNR